MDARWDSNPHFLKTKRHPCLTTCVFLNNYAKKYIVPIGWNQPPNSAYFIRFSDNQIIRGRFRTKVCSVQTSHRVSDVKPHILSFSLGHGLLVSPVYFPGLLDISIYESLSKNSLNAHLMPNSVLLVVVRTFAPDFHAVPTCLSNDLTRGNEIVNVLLLDEASVAHLVVVQAIGNHVTDEILRHAKIFGGCLVCQPVPLHLRHLLSTGTSPSRIARTRRMFSSKNFCVS